jgi:hypothetical protein
MREAINAYATAVAGTGPGASDPVWKLPVYLPVTRPSAEELATVNQQQLAQPVIPVLGSNLPALDSLQRLNLVYPEGEDGVDYTSGDEEEGHNALVGHADEPGHEDEEQPPLDSLQALGASDVDE